MPKKTPKTFHLVSLGCAKNTVDSDSMAQLLSGAGLRAVTDPKKAGVLIVNTCGFIGPAKEESYQVLGELAAQKRSHQFLIAAGCLTQRYGSEVVQKVPGIDGVLGTRRWMDIVDVVAGLRQKKHPEPLYHLPAEAGTVGKDEKDTLRVAVQGTSAYIKIADGCRRPCAFCAIPLIKGTAVSRPVESILNEARTLRDMGVRELILIAQDSTDYGHDLDLKDGLSLLLDQMVHAVPDVDWIRVMYAFPGYVTDRLIETIATHQQLIPYLDMPLQHAHPRTLRRMRRPANMDWVRRTIQKMRTAMPELALRSTFIVGYPGETGGEFQTLLDFIEEIRFDRVGAFKFSFEPGTASEPLGDPVPGEVKQARWEALMARQQDISLEKNQAFVNRILDVLVEGQGDVEGTSEKISIGRTYRDAPEIDGVVLIEGDIPPGEMVPVRITGALAYDLTGTVDWAGKTVVGLDEVKIPVGDESYNDVRPK
jgi:ribosomal protein S12 methylthiotransferase